MHVFCHRNFPILTSNSNLTQPKVTKDQVMSIYVYELYIYVHGNTYFFPLCASKKNGTSALNLNLFKKNCSRIE